MIKDNTPVSLYKYRIYREQDGSPPCRFTSLNDGTVHLRALLNIYCCVAGLGWAVAGLGLALGVSVFPNMLAWLVSVCKPAAYVCRDSPVCRGPCASP